MKRMVLWGGTNMAVIAVISLIVKITGIEQALGGQQNYIALLIMCSGIGFVGSFISLQSSKTMAKRGMNVRVIEAPQNEFERWYLGVVRQQAERLNIAMPEVGIFHSPSPNAFATGASKNNSLVAISTGLAEIMNRDEIEAVVGHEMAHVANGDMVTMMLLQGVVNTFVLFFAKIIALALASRGQDRDSNAQPNMATYMMFEMVFQLIFGFLAQIITSWFSRHREYRADEGGAMLTSNEQMARALEALKHGVSPKQAPLTEEFKAFGINGVFSSLFSTHPPLDARINALRQRG